MLVNLRKASDAEFQVDLRVCRVSAAFAQGQLGDLLARDGNDAVVVGAEPIQRVVGNDSVVRLIRAMLADPSTQIKQSPQVTVRQLQATRIRVGRDVGYVRSFDLQSRPDGKQIAIPILDKLWQGHDAEVVVALIGKAKVAVEMDLLVNSMDIPIQKFHADVAGVAEGVMVEVPRVTSFRGSQFAEVTSGSTVVVALPSGDTWLLALLTVHQVRAAPRGR